MKWNVDQALNSNISTYTTPVRPFFLIGFYALIFLSPFFRGLFFENDLLLAVIITAVIFIICLADQLKNIDFDFFSDSLFLSMLALLLAYILSTITAVHRHDAIVELIRMGSYTMVFWMAVRTGENKTDFRNLLLVAYMAAVGMAIIGLAASLGIIHWPGAWEDGHIRSSLQYHNALAIYLAAMNMVGLAFSLQNKQGFPSWAFTAGNYLLFLVIMGSLSRGTWLLYPLAMASFVFLIPIVYRRKALTEIIIFIVAGLFAGRLVFNLISHSRPLGAGLYLLLGLLLVVVVSLLKESRLIFPSQVIRNMFKPRILAITALVGLTLMGIFFVARPSSFTGFLRHVVPDTAIARTQKTSVQDSSFQDRLTTDLDAWKIIKDYPLTGTGGGGWKALYHSYASRLYWVNDVHNAYLQTWVEAGILGFAALIAMLFFFLHLIIRTWSVNRENPDCILLWSAAVAVLLIAIHSTFDFELSMPAVAFLFFALIGLVRGRTMAMQTGKEDLNSSREKVRGRSLGSRPLAHYVLIILVGILGISAGITAFCYYSADRIGLKGAEALESKQLQSARDLYLEAAKLDPYKGAYRVNLAQIAAIRANRDKDASAAGEGLNHARIASELEPYNTSLHAAVFSIYGMLGRPDLQLSAAESAIRANPYLPAPYEQMAGVTMQIAMQYLDKGQNEAAFSYFRKLLVARNKMPAEIGDSTPGFNLATGQSALLLGDTEQARKYFNLLLQDENKHAKTARLWLNGVDFMEARMKSRLDGTADANSDLAALQAFLKKQIVQ